jgi:uncharacterized membrane protein
MKFNEIVKQLLNIHSNKGRYWEVDSFRGLAILFMIFYHFMWDMQNFGFAEINMLRGFWQAFGRVIGSSFLFISGISILIASQKADSAGKNITRKVLKRAGIVFFWGMVISVAFFALYGANGGVIFGILHMLAVGIVLGYFVSKLHPLIILILTLATGNFWFLYVL